MDPRLKFIIAGGEIVGDFLDAVHHSRAMGGVQPVPVRPPRKSKPYQRLRASMWASPLSL